jgi:hypothetical protein
VLLCEGDTLTFHAIAPEGVRRRAATSTTVRARMAFKRREDQRVGEARDGCGVGLRGILGGFAQPRRAESRRSAWGHVLVAPRV